MGSPYGPWYEDEDEPRHAAASRPTLRGLAADLALRYQSARLATRVTIDLAAAVIVMTLAVGAAIALRDTGPDRVAVAAATTTTTAATTTTPIVTTTTLPPTTAPPTTAPTTTTSRPRPTTTTTAPPAPPPSEAPPPTAPPTTEPPSYRSCDDARRAGATLPIPSGQPGYRRSLDPDRDGLACEADEDDWGWGWG